MTRRHLFIGTTLLAALTTLGVTQWALDRSVAAQATVQAPRFEVDPFWPKPLPNNWVLGEAIGLGIDGQDHVWIVHRSDRSMPSKGPRIRSRRPRHAAAGRRGSSSSIGGNLVGHGGDPGSYEWPVSNHGIFVDQKDNVWIEATTRAMRTS